MRATKFLPILLLITLVSILGCSNGGDMPMMPSDDLSGLGATPFQPGDRQEAQEAVEQYSGSHQLWGYYMVEVSEDHQDVSVIPLRNASQHFNVLNYLESSPCTNCLKIVTKDFPGGGVIDFGIQMRHPFPGQTYFSGFDVRGIAIFNASGTFPINNLKYSIRETGDAEIVNPDGYTHLYHVATQGSGTNGAQGYVKGSMSSPQAPDGTLNAYKNFYTSDNRNFFLAGDVLQRTYRVDPPVGAFVFGYAVDANWAPPQTQPVENVPDDFGLNANSPEAYDISVTVSDGLFSNGGSADVEIWVYDWQGFATIDSVKLEAPDLFGSLVEADFDSISGDHVAFTAEITNALGSVEGTYDMLIAVEDTANATSPDYLDLTAYEIVEVTVEEGLPNLDPIAIAEADETDITQGTTVNFDATASYDPDGAGIFLYEWDLDGDGAYDDEAGADLSIVSWEYLDVGDFDIDVKVWDALSATDTLDEKITISVEGDACAGHYPDAKAKADDYTPNVEVQVKFTDISTDPDGFGDLAYYEWDFTGEAEPYDPVYDPDSKETFYTYTVGGDFYMYHRVTDLANCVDELDVPLLIEVNGPPVAAGHADSYGITSGQQITFYSDATDPDGNGPINGDGYLWDLDGDPETGTDGYEEVGPIVVHQYYSPGTINIRHKVVDSKGLEDELDPIFQVVISPLGDVVVHLSEEEAMNPIGAEYDFRALFGDIGGTSIINYLDFDGPWDFTDLLPNTTFSQDILDKNDPTYSSHNSNWPSLQYYILQSGPSSLSGSLTEAVGAFSRSYTSPPDDGFQYNYGIIDVTPGMYDDVVFVPYNAMAWPIDKYTNQYDSFDWSALGVPIFTEVWTTGIGQGTVICEVNGVEESYNALLLKVVQRDVDQVLFTTLSHTISYRWISDDGLELAAITAVNAATNPDNWNAASGLITGNGTIRWLFTYDLGS